MADVKFTALPAASAVTATDIFAMVDDPSGTPVSQKATAAQLLAYISGGVKVYRAKLTQSGTLAPTATVLENSFGATLVWSRVSGGQYKATLSGAFPLAKTFALSGGHIGNAGTCIQLQATGDNNSVTLYVWDFDAAGLNDDMLDDTSVEIRVYP